MKKVLQSLISMPFLMIMLLVYAISMGVATFVESNYNPGISRYLIYNTWWFELIQLILIINFIGNIFKYKLYKKEKWSICLFHIAFAIILVGAGVTRYVGFEGNMHIREGESENKFMSEKSYMIISNANQNDTLILKKELFISPYLKNNYQTGFKLGENKFEFEVKEYIPNAIKKLMKDEKGFPIMELVISTGSGMQSYYLTNKSSIKVGKQIFCLNNQAESDSSIVFNIEKNNLTIETPFELKRLRNKGNADSILSPGKKHVLKSFESFGNENLKFSIVSFYEKAKIAYVHGNAENENDLTILSCSIKSGDEERELYIPIVHGQVGESVAVNIKNQQLLVSYGTEEMELPFSLKLNDFQLERYPGSESPSSYASEVTLIDEGSNVKKDYRIFMNNILDYKGYRFFQSSYDQDEKGTILSVSHDKPGTYLSYFGYFLMTLGMAWALFSKNSHFAELRKKASELNKKRKSITTIAIIAFFVLAQNTYAQDSTIIKIDRNHADHFGHILVQDNAGRIKPLNTLNNELLRKISRKDAINGLDPNQVILGMMFNPQYWQKQPIIKVGHPDLLKIIGADQKLVSFMQFIDEKTGEYKLKKLLDAAFEKKPEERDKLAKEIIAVDERVNLVYQIYSAQFLKVFPIPGDINKPWVIPSETKVIKQEAEGKFATFIFLNYYNAVIKTQETNDWTAPNLIVDSLINFQKKNAETLYPSDLKVNLEIKYVNYDIFNTIYKYYGLIGFVFLIILFVGILKPNLKIKHISLGITILLALIFIIQSAGLGVRWYISGHAPMSNGYESMIYISWAIMLAGFIFMKRSTIVLAATAILASITLMVAHLSWMDPQITNLVPVLKSYWLTIHVSVITSSYGFLGLGALLGLLNLIVMIMKNSKNGKNLDFTIEELTIINHMTLIIGIFLLSIGTFLGAVWANESWGRYWGWDPKETWALISIIVYTIVLHSRLIPGFNNKYTFNLLSLLGFSSILMTYFGVNYYLSGMHSYAQGDPIPVPVWVYVAIGVVLLVSVVAYFRNRYSGVKKEEDKL